MGRGRLAGMLNRYSWNTVLVSAKSFPNIRALPSVVDIDAGACWGCKLFSVPAAGWPRQGGNKTPKDLAPSGEAVVSQGCRPCNRRRGANHNPGRSEQNSHSSLTSLKSCRTAKLPGTRQQFASEAPFHCTQQPRVMNSEYVSISPSRRDVRARHPISMSFELSRSLRGVPSGRDVSKTSLPL
jgi:hypothetical protein